MKNSYQNPDIETKKVVSITLLFAAAVLIMIVGLIFSILSFINHISFPVMNFTVHGSVFGLLVVFLGLRYFMIVFKLRAEVYKTTSKFSWSNFKHIKK